MIKGIIRKHILKDLPTGSQVELIAKFSNNRFGIKRIGHKVRDLSCKKMLVMFGTDECSVSYFHLTCYDIEMTKDVIRTLEGIVKEDSDLPF